MREVDLAELETAIGNGATVLDVRQPEEFTDLRVPSAVLIPLPDLPARTAEVPAGDPVYVICAAGVRSLRGAQILLRSGREAVSVAGGTNAWAASGRPVESGGA